MNLFWWKCKKLLWWYLSGLVIVGGYLTLAVIYADKNSTVFLSVPELIRHHGYNAEIHHVHTPDGFVLEHHRIPHGRFSTSFGPPVILQHGFSSSSSFWVYNGAHDLAFLLADAGFDVWLLNIRAGSVCRLHGAFKNIQTFNDFSFHEFALVDLPTTIDYIISTTGFEKVSYIGHSMGSSLLPMLLSERPEYNTKVNYYIGIAPVWYKGKITEKSLPGIALQMFPTFVPALFYLNDVANLIGRQAMRKYIVHYLFESPYVSCFSKNMLKIGRNAFFGTYMNQTASFPDALYWATNPDGYMYYTLKHYTENSASGEHRMRDYGTEKNLQEYNSSSPPIYKTDQFYVPSSIYYSEIDTLSDLQTVEWIVPRLKNLDRIRHIHGYDHLEIVVEAKGASQIYFFEVIETLGRATNNTECPNSMNRA